MGTREEILANLTVQLAELGDQFGGYMNTVLADKTIDMDTQDHYNQDEQED